MTLAKLTENYFAYGSNMDGAQLAERVGPMQCLGVGRLKDHILAFNRRGTYRPGGVASVEPKSGRDVYGVVWRISPDGLSELDRIEDPAAYHRQSMIIEMRSGETIRCQVYVSFPEGVVSPDPDYLDLIIRAAKKVGLPADYIREIEALRQR
jgi:gamma-glutamylcyclotransferase (GGCT)/AIG2-like uncharacterized protein YtfP